MLQLNRLKSI